MRNALVVGLVVGALFGACGGVGGPGGATGQSFGAINGKAFAVGSSAASTSTLLFSEDSAVCDPTGSIAMAHPGTRLMGFGAPWFNPDGGPCSDMCDSHAKSAWAMGTQEGWVNVAAIPAGSCDAGTPYETSKPGKYVQPNLVASGKATVTIESLSPSLRGRFKATLESGATLEGSFDAPFCSADAYAIRCVEP